MNVRNILLGSICAAISWSGLASADNHYESIVTVDQGWDNADRNFFYFSPQGSPIIPFDYFKALEQPDSEGLFLDREFLKDLGMIYWDDPKADPQGLPIGLTVDVGRIGTEKYLGMNCSACHVTEIKVGGKSALVDGGVSHFDFWTFMTKLHEAVRQTHEDDAKFDRFVKRFQQNQTLVKDPAQIRARLRKVLQARDDWAFRNHTPIAPGPGRVDALNVILNQVTAMMLHRPENARTPDAPVSYPFLWDAPYMNVVQYNGSVPNAGAGAIGRNVGQVLGVFGEVDLAESTMPLGYDSSVNVSHLMALEERLETLKSPRWTDFSEKGLLPALDQGLVNQGEKIYQANCLSCHSIMDRDNRGELASIEIPTFSLDKIGTDPLAAMGFSAREVVTGPIEGRKIGYAVGEPFCEVTHGNAVLAHVVAAVILNNLSVDRGAVETATLEVIEDSIHAKFKSWTNEIRSALGFKNDEKKSAKPDYETLINNLSAKGLTPTQIAAHLQEISDDKSELFDELVKDHFEYQGADQHCMEVLQTAQYRARPLNGIWATGPFLHNGSVPTLADILEDETDRPKSFMVGDGEFDPVKVGFVPPKGAKNYQFDTSVKGNSNAGHNYGTDLDPQSKKALIEYLKSL